MRIVCFDESCDVRKTPCDQIASPMIATSTSQASKPGACSTAYALRYSVLTRIQSTVRPLRMLSLSVQQSRTLVVAPCSSMVENLAQVATATQPYSEPSVPCSAQRIAELTGILVSIAAEVRCGAAIRHCAPASFFVPRLSTASCYALLQLPTELCLFEE